MFNCLLKAQTSPSDSITKLKIDSLKIKLTNDSLRIFRFKKVRPYLSIDNRNSFIKNAPINIKGLQLGTILFEKHTVGLGIYNITKKTQKPVLTNDKNRLVNQYLTLGYATAFYQYKIIDRRFFELDVPMEIGFGRYQIVYKDSLSQNIISHIEGGIIPMGGGAQIVLKPLRWIGVSLNTGYRIVLDKNKKLNFNGAYYSFGVWVDVRQIIRDTRYYLIKKPRYRKAIRLLNNH